MDSAERIREAIDVIPHWRELRADIYVLRRALVELVAWREMYPEAVGIVGQTRSDAEQGGVR